MPKFQIEKTVCVVGLGYIGLPTATALARCGMMVVGVDVNPKVVETINRGEIHIVEPDLDNAVQASVRNGRLRATLVPEAADVFFIAVPTPFKGENKEPDLTYIKAASRSIAPVLKTGDLVILESTSPVGTTEQMAAWLSEQRSDLTFPQQAAEESDIRIAHCPERVLPGRVMYELVNNDRIIGGMTYRCAAEAKAMYDYFVAGDCIVTDVRTAEMCKLAENAFRDVNIAFANELSLICDRLGIDVWNLIRSANRHPRVNILQPGAGVGGHCIAVDPWFIVSNAPDESQLVRTAREVNDRKPQWVLQKVSAAVEEFSTRHGSGNPVVAVLGLAFKPDIDDLRESPAVMIAEKLFREHGPRFLAVEPHVSEMPPCMSGASLATLDEAIEQANIIVLLVNHSAFQRLQHTRLRADQNILDIAGLLANRSGCGPAVFRKPLSAAE
jgi:UDP-N-acetyl-D-mannosaminuronic acid dehydrogenase